MGVVRSISRLIHGIAGKWALPTERAFWVVDIYRCSLLFVSPSLRHGKIAETVLTIMINSNLSQYTATFKVS